jgi:DNA polymerase-4
VTGTPTPGILHVDLDAFYASVEQLHDPALRGRPVVVGGLGPRGVVAAASYEARRHGVQSAMPMVRARRACPDGVFLAPRFDAYREASHDVLSILRSFTPLVEPIALDEAFLDVRGARRLHGTGPEIAAAIRARVHEDTGLVASVGVAGTKLLAKLASDLSKPDGLLVVEPGDELVFLHPLGVERLWGVGPATRRRLGELGVRTVGDLAAIPPSTLTNLLGEAAGRHLHELSWNRDLRPVEPSRVAKSIGHEETFPADIGERAALEHALARLADGVGSRLRAAGVVGRTVHLKVRYADFRSITRAHTLPEPTAVAAEIARTASALLDGVPVDGGVRLLGVAVSRLGPPGTRQPRLFALPEEAGGPEARTPRVARAADDRRAAVERSVDAVRARFGADAVRPARGRWPGGATLLDDEPSGRTDGDRNGRAHDGADDGPRGADDRGEGEHSGSPGEDPRAAVR